MATINSTVTSYGNVLAYPSGFTFQWMHQYAAPMSGTDTVVEYIDFVSLETFDVTLGSVSSAMDALKKSIAQHGSTLYAAALYSEEIYNFQIPDSFTIPSQICIPLPLIGNFCFPLPGAGTYQVPGGGTVLARATQYRLYYLHSQVQIAFGLAILALTAVISLVILAHDQSIPALFDHMTTDVQTVFQGWENILPATAGSATTTLVLASFAGLIFIVAGYMVYTASYKITNNPTLVRLPNLPMTPGIGPSTVIEGYRAPGTIAASGQQVVGAYTTAATAPASVAGSYRAIGRPPARQRPPARTARRARA